MDFNSIMTAIGTIGFPIVMCILMLKYMQNSEDRHREDCESWRGAIVELTTVINDLNNNIKTNENLQGTISNLTSVVNELITTIKGGEENGG